MERNRDAAPQQYYVAVGRAESRLPTLLDLLQAISESSPPAEALTVVICCSSRDTCDETIHSLAQGTSFALACLHADMSGPELGLVAEAFASAAAARAAAATQADRLTAQVEEQFVHPDEARAQGARDAAEPAAPAAMRLLVCTDAALRAVPPASLPLDARLLINLDLPASKEGHHSRITGALGGGDESAPRRRAVIHFVVAGQVAQFRRLEKLSNAAIHEMPIHAADILV